MKLEWSQEALADLDRFALFLNDHHPSLARIIAQELIKTTHLLIANPRLGRPIGGRDEYRQIVLRVLNTAYVFQYRLDEERLVIVNGGEIPGQCGGVKVGHWRGGCAGMKRSPIGGPLFMPAAKFLPRLCGGDFAGHGINGFVRRSIVSARAGKLAATRGLREPVAFAVHRQNRDMVGQSIEKRAGQAAREPPATAQQT